ncbi:MAG: N-6 DNA methylase [Clostridiales bacterium]|nr:N-6 DNA methylase [Clostridiales bacterium]
MGRKDKLIKEEISKDKSINKRELGYYSTPDYICNYIADRLFSINNEGKSVFDPCCGREEMLRPFINKNIKCYGIDVYRYKDTYDCNFQNIDFLKFYISNIAYNGKISPLEYDYYVLNPPYNCHEVKYIKDNKDRLKAKFKDVGIQNMYLMFISAVIDLAKEGALIGIITSDSFFTAKSYKKFRKKILDKCSIHEITMCPTNLFLNQGADVRTSIIILQKGTKYQGKVILNNRINNKRDFEAKLKKRELENNKYFIEDILLKDDRDNLEFLIECPKEIKLLFNNKRIGDIYKCITGISTGNDKLYLSKECKSQYTVPFYKNPGKDKFYTEKKLFIDKNFLKISKKVANFIVRNKEYLFKEGVICSSMGVEFSACKLPKDSVFGVNCCILCDGEEEFFLLSYLNSTLVTYLVRGVLNRTNMITSGYIARVPLINFEKEEKERLIALGRLAYEKSKKKEDIKEILKEINNLINKACKLTNETIDFIEEFKENLVRRA